MIFYSTLMNKDMPIWTHVLKFLQKMKYSITGIEIHKGRRDTLPCVGNYYKSLLADQLSSKPTILQTVA